MYYGQLFARQLRVIRKQNNFTQQQIADMLGISRSAYCGYETGRRSPDLDTVSRLSEFYRIPPSRFMDELSSDYLFDASPYEGQSDTRYLSQLSREELEVIYNYRISSDEGKNKILQNSRETAKNTAKNKK